MLDAGTNLPAPGPEISRHNKLPFTSTLREQVGQIKEGAEKTWGCLLVDKLLNLAVDGNLRAIQEVWTRLEGKPGAPVTSEAPPFTVSDEVARSLLENDRDDEDDEDHDDETDGEDRGDDN